MTTVPLVCDGFQPLPEEVRKLIVTWWTPQQQQILANYGVEIDDVHAAYTWLQHELSPLRMPRFGPVWEREQIVGDMLLRCGVLSSRRSSFSLSRRTSSRDRLAPARARILIIGSVSHAESLSSCEVFRILLQGKLHVECEVVHGKRQMASWKPWAYYLVVLLVRGIFNDPLFARMLLASSKPPGRSLQVLTLVADPQFEFPNFDQDPAFSVHEGPAADREELFQVFRSLMNVVALPFSPLASEGLQQKQVAEIAERIHRYKDPAAAGKDEADDRATEVPEDVAVEPRGSDASLETFGLGLSEDEASRAVMEKPDAISI